MKKAVLEWIDASKRLPSAKDYNKDGFVIVAYEDGSVGKGYYTISDTWAYKNRHGNALFWAPYPAHPCNEDIKHASM